MWGLSYHGVGAQSSVSRVHLLYLRHQGLEQGVGGGGGGAGGGDVLVAGGAPHALLAALRGHGAGPALLGHTATSQRGSCSGTCRRSGRPLPGEDPSPAGWPPARPGTWLPRSGMGAPPAGCVLRAAAASWS